MPHVLGGGSHKHSRPALQLILGDTHSQVPRMATVSICRGLGSMLLTIPQMTRNTSCDTAGSRSQAKCPLQGSTSLLVEELSPASFGCWILKIGERASVDLAVFYNASVYKNPSPLHVLMRYINALKNMKTGGISPCK